MSKQNRNIKKGCRNETFIEKLSQNISVISGGKFNQKIKSLNSSVTQIVFSTLSSHSELKENRSEYVSANGEIKAYVSENKIYVTTGSGHWDVSKVTESDYMFYNSLNLSKKEHSGGFIDWFASLFYDVQLANTTADGFLTEY